MSSVHHHPHVRENVDIILYNVIYIYRQWITFTASATNEHDEVTHTHTHIIDIGGLSSVHCVVLTGSEGVHSSNSVARLHQLIVV